jgi:probable F420-dependent oxidoreductase
MQIGVLFPQTEIGPGSAEVARFVREVENLGFAHLVAYEHVVGADRRVHENLDYPYGIEDLFHEPFVLFGFIAAITSLELATAIVIAPQRQTVLLAKQAAEVDVLTGGRFRLGVGLGWNPVEYEALGMDFATRSIRLEGQIELLRRLWTEESVTHDYGDERVVAAGLCPMPLQRPIPIWIGAVGERALRRAGRLADGWIPNVRPGDELDAAIRVVTGAAEAAGRDSAAIGMEGRMSGAGDADKLRRAADRWRTAGATHLAVGTMGLGLTDLDDHLRILERAATALLA